MNAAESPGEDLGAYGMRLRGLRLPYHRFGPISPDAPLWDVAISAGEPGQGFPAPVSLGDDLRAITLTDEMATIPLFGAAATVDAVAQTVRIEVENESDTESIAHPYLAGVGACAAWWRGWLSFHGGAVVIDGGAIALLAERSEGKSTSLFLFDRAGFPVLTDDLIVVDDTLAVHVGPRAIDLRQAPEGHPAVRMQGVGRERHRVTPAPAPATAPLRGIVRLAWASDDAEDDAGIVIPPTADKLALLSRARTIHGAGGNDRLLLDLAAIPMAVIYRRRSPETMTTTIELLQQFSASLP